MPHPFQIFSQSDYLIQIADINSHTEWQKVQIQISWLLRSQLIWIYTVFKGREYPGSAGQGLSLQESKQRVTKFISPDKHTAVLSTSLGKICFAWRFISNESILS